MMFRRNPWIILFLLLVPLNFVLGIDRTALTISSPLVQQALHIDPVRMAELITISTAAYALLQVPSGWLTHRVGVRWALSGACLMWSVATILTSFQTDLTGFFAVRILLGVGQAPDWVACIFALKLLFPAAEREAASSTLLGGLYIGYAVSGVLTAYVLQLAGWRGCFLIYGMIGLVLSIITFFCYADPTHENRGKVKVTEDPKPRGRPALLPVAQIAIFYACVSGVQSFCHVTFLHFLTSRFGLSGFEAGRLFSVPSVALYVGVVVSGFIIKRMKRAGRLYSAAGMRIFGIIWATGCMAGTVLSPTLWGALTFSAGAMVGVGLCQVLNWSHVQSFSRGTAIVAGCTALAGNWVASIGPVWSEMLFRQLHSWSILAVLAAGYGVVATCVWFIPSRKQEESQDNTMTIATTGTEFE